METETAIRYLQRGRYQLLQRHPFLGYCACKLVFQETKTGSLATDAEKLYFNPEYVLSCKTEQYPDYVYAVTAVAHEVLHAALNHCKDWKAKGYDPALANVAMDLVLALMLTEMGFPIHPTWLQPVAKWQGKTWQEVYYELKKQAQKLPKINVDVLVQPGPGNGNGGSGGEEKDEESVSPSAGGGGKRTAPPGSFPGKPDSSGTGKGKSRNDWDRILVEAAKYAEAMGNCPARFKDMVKEITKPRINWKAVLYRYLSRAKKGDYSFRRPNKRYLHLGLVMPSLHSYTADAVIAVDTSGSCWNILGQFFGEVAGIVRSLGVFVDVAQCDAEVQNVFRLRKPHDVKKLQKHGGGGTDFRPIFDWVAKRKKPEVLIFLTDGYGTYPEAPPAYRVLWCIPEDAIAHLKTSGYYPKFGTVLPLPMGEKKKETA